LRHSQKKINYYIPFDREFYELQNEGEGESDDEDKGEGEV
jgi:hypothetical protein